MENLQTSEPKNIFLKNKFLGLGFCWNNVENSNKNNPGERVPNQLFLTDTPTSMTSAEGAALVARGTFGSEVTSWFIIHSGFC